MPVMQLRRLVVLFVIGCNCSLLYGNELINTDKKNNVASGSSEADQLKSEINSFKHLLKNRKGKKRKIENDGIHDLTAASAKVLQNPEEAFVGLPKAKSGNGVDWDKARDMGKIKPSSDLYDPDLEPLVMNLNIVMEVKGTMPDVVFRHKQHTEILDCINCHPAIFLPKKGENKINMSMNLMGQKCGVCHGTVAFPLSRCTSCHSKKKPQKEIKKGKWTWP